MKRYLRMAGKHWYCFVLAPIFMVIEACGEFILPFLNANIINNGAAMHDIDYILRNGLYMLLIALGMLVTGVLGANFAIRGAAYMSAQLRLETFKKIQKFSFANIDDFSTGSLITRITNDVTQIQTFTQSLLRGFFRSPVMLIGAICMSFFLNRELALVICIVVPVLACLIALIIKIASPRYTVMQNKIDALNNSVDETITNERVIKSFVREEYEKKRFAVVNDELMKKSTKALKMMMILQPLSTFAINLTTLIVVWLAGKQVMVGDMEVGTLTAFITYLTQVMMALDFLANIFLSGTRAVASGKRITQVLDAQIELNDDNAKAFDKTIEHGSIKMQDVSFRYFKNSHRQVLSDVSFEINEGEFIGIVGATGSAKTTLVSLIPRLYDVESGSVMVDGTDVRNYSLMHLREKVAVVLQKNTLFSGSIAENLRWGNEDADINEIKWACKIAQADEFIDTFKDRYDTELEQGGLNLSGGQRQRLCIARALLKHPKILILDDSTSAVDMATDAKIRNAFKKELSGITKIIIAQRINSVIDADKILVLDEGRVAGFGTHESLIKDCEAYREIYYSQNDKEAV